MNTNGQLNGNGSHKPNGLLNGNGNLRVTQAKAKHSWLKDWWINYADLRYALLVYGSLAALIGGLALWNHYHPQPQSPPDPPDPRIAQVEKTIEQLQDAIEVLKEELPPEEEQAPEYPDR